MRRGGIVMAGVLSGLLASTPVMAQQHVADTAALRTAVARQAAADRADRDVVVGVLKRDDVRRVAASLGLDIARAESAVATLEGSELARVANAARAADADLHGGVSTVTISITTLLLLLILIVLIAR